MKSKRKPPTWIPIEKLDIFDRKLFMANIDVGIMGSCTPLKNGQFKWDSTYSKYPDLKPTHYWSF